MKQNEDTLMAEKPDTMFTTGGNPVADKQNSIQPI
jgi:hypothetical protein